MEYQRAAFERLVGPIDLVCNSRAGPMLNGEVARAYPIQIRRLSPLNHYAVFYSYLPRLVDLGSYDFIYVRYPFAIPSFLWFLRQAARTSPRAKVVVEIATYPYKHELQTYRQKVFGWLDDRGAGMLKRYVDAIVTFYGQSEIHGIPCIQSANGIEVDALPLRRRTRNEGLSIISVGNLAERHGVDRAIRGLAGDLDEGTEKATLHVVGDGPAIGGLTTLANELGVATQVKFHGTLTGRALDEVFEDADVALDSLGVHRLALPSSSSLKAREYCARGIPFVMAGHDPDFAERTPFVHRVPPDDSPLDFSALRAFVAQTIDAPDLSERMRAYAKAHLAWDVKLAPIVEFLGREQVRVS